MQSLDEETEHSSIRAPDRHPEHVAGEIGRTVRDALNSRTRTARLCLILASLGAGIAVPLLVSLTVVLLIVGGR